MQPLMKGSRLSLLGGIENSVAVEFDTFDDEGIEVRSCGAQSYTKDETALRCQQGAARFPVDIKDGALTLFTYRGGKRTKLDVVR